MPTSSSLSSGLNVGLDSPAAGRAGFSTSSMSRKAEPESGSNFLKAEKDRKCIERISLS
jgi:hypothetical protein